MVFSMPLVCALLVAGCGSGEEADDQGLSGKEADVAYAAAMIPHHDAAIQMARIAGERAEHPEISQLSTMIMASQEAEITSLEATYNRLTGQKSRSRDHAREGMSHDMMGMSAEEMGMNMDPAVLREADPFDKAFIDMMIPHHQGAIRMARMQVADGDDESLKELSEQIITAQSAEIEEMNRWREAWYGSASPSGGVPEVEESERGHSH